MSAVLCGLCLVLGSVAGVGGVGLVRACVYRLAVLVWEAGTARAVVGAFKAVRRPPAQQRSSLLPVPQPALPRCAHRDALPQVHGVRHLPRRMVSVTWRGLPCVVAAALFCCCCCCCRDLTTCTTLYPSNPDPPSTACPSTTPQSVACIDVVCCCRLSVCSFVLPAIPLPHTSV